MLRNLNRDIKAIKERTRKGIIKAGFIALNGAMSKCPVDTGNLRASGFLVWEGRQPSPPKWSEFHRSTETRSYSLNAATGKVSRAKVTKTQGAQLTKEQFAALESAWQETVAKAQGNLDGKKFVVALGFGAAYAIFVHENAAARHPSGQWKFLEASLLENRKRMLDVIRAEAAKEAA